MSMYNNLPKKMSSVFFNVDPGIYSNFKLISNCAQAQQEFQCTVYCDPCLYIWHWKNTHWAWSSSKWLLWLLTPWSFMDLLGSVVKKATFDSDGKTFFLLLQNAKLYIPCWPFSDWHCSRENCGFHSLSLEPTWHERLISRWLKTKYKVSTRKYIQDKSCWMPSLCV